MHQQLFMALLIVAAANAARGDEVECVFSATRIISVSGGVDTRPRPFAKCWVYVFWADTDGGELKFHHFTGSPGKTDDSGLSTFKFERNKTYYLYFAGRELTAAQVQRLVDKRPTLLLHYLVTEAQAADSPFSVKKVGDRLEANAKFSLPLWIAHLQRFESELAAASVAKPAEVLSKLRQLFYEGRHWDWLVPRRVEPVFEFDRPTGKITMNNAVSLDTCEAVSNKYKRNGDTYEMTTTTEGGKVRQKVERFDYVSLRNGEAIQIGHVLTAAESELTPPNFIVRARIKEGVAAASWSGDLGQAVALAVENSAIKTEPPTDDEWNNALGLKANAWELAGDIVGAGNAREFKQAIVDKHAVSEVIESLLYNPELMEESAKRFVKRYSFNLNQPPAETIDVISPYIDEFADDWSEPWDDAVEKVKGPTLVRAAEHLIDVLQLMLDEIPDVEPITPELLDRDFDGLTTEEEASFHTDPILRDSDNDGLWDGWEAYGVIPDVGVELPDANPLVPDVYVQIDWFKGIDSQRDAIENALQTVVDAFSTHRAAKSTNGRINPAKGIHLHLEWSAAPLPDVENLVVRLLGTTPWDNIRDANFPKEKRLTHRHALLALTLEGGRTGYANGQSFVVDASVMNQGGSVEQQSRMLASRFMKQLGFTLGLSYGGLFEVTSDGKPQIVQEFVRYKPNHVSIMNDSWEAGVRREDESGNVRWVLDYQDFDIPQNLNAMALNEPAGLGLHTSTAETRGWSTLNRGRNKNHYLGIEGAIDWNLDGDGGQDTGLKENLNGRWSNTNYRATLREWDRLQCVAGSIGSVFLYSQLLERPEPGPIE